jgi:hypothetical protein
MRMFFSGDIMAEIKSTLDIIMERTRHLVLSADEKQQIERDDQLRKVPGYLQKYLDGVGDLDDLLEDIATLPEEHRHEVKQELIKRLVKELGFDPRGRRVLEALQGLAPREDLGKVAELHQLLDRFDESRHELVTARSEQARTRLAALGISGSAVVVREEKDPEWELRSHEYANQLQALQTAW